MLTKMNGVLTRIAPASIASGTPQRPRPVIVHQARCLRASSRTAAP